MVRLKISYVFQYDNDNLKCSSLKRSLACTESLLGRRGDGWRTGRGKGWPGGEGGVVSE